MSLNISKTKYFNQIIFLSKIFFFSKYIQIKYMVHKNYKWNISKEEGSKLLDDKIREILVERNDRIEISELNFAIQNRTKDIIVMNNKKKKNLINFIKVVLGGLKYYLEENKENYFLTNENKKTYIELSVINSIKLNDWVFVDDD